LRSKLGCKQVQQGILQAQQQYINDLKQMIALLLKRKMKRPKTQSSSSKGIGKERDGENSASERTESDDNSNL